MDNNYVFLCSLRSDVVQVRTGRCRQGTTQGGGFWGPEYERNGLGNVGERCVSLEGVGKTGTTLFPHAPSGRTMWMRSCAFCKALLYKVRLCDSARCRCGWIW